MIEVDSFRIRRQDRLWRNMIAGLTSVSLIMGDSGHLYAEWFARPKVPKVNQPAEPQSNNSFDEAIRKLLKEAKAAENKGEIDRAVFLAERAAKISESSAGLVKSASDVSPTTTSSYARVLRQKRAELIAKRSTSSPLNESPVVADKAANKTVPVNEKPQPSRQLESIQSDPAQVASKTSAPANARQRKTAELTPSQSQEPQADDLPPLPVAVAKRSNPVIKREKVNHKADDAPEVLVSTDDSNSSVGQTLPSKQTSPNSLANPRQVHRVPDTSNNLSRQAATPDRQDLERSALTISDSHDGHNPDEGLNSAEIADSANVPTSADLHRSTKNSTLDAETSVQKRSDSLAPENTTFTQRSIVEAGTQDQAPSIAIKTKAAAPASVNPEVGINPNARENPSTSKDQSVVLREKAPSPKRVTDIRESLHNDTTEGVSNRVDGTREHSDSNIPKTAGVTIRPKFESIDQGAQKRSDDDVLTPATPHTDITTAASDPAVSRRSLPTNSTPPEITSNEDVTADSARTSKLPRRGVSQPSKETAPAESPALANLRAAFRDFAEASATKGSVEPLIASQNSQKEEPKIARRRTSREVIPDANVRLSKSASRDSSEPAKRRLENGEPMATATVVSRSDTGPRSNPLEKNERTIANGEASNRSVTSAARKATDLVSSAPSKSMKLRPESEKIQSTPVTAAKVEQPIVTEESASEVTVAADLPVTNAEAHGPHATSASEPTAASRSVKLRKRDHNSPAIDTVGQIDHQPIAPVGSINEEAVAAKENHDEKSIDVAIEPKMSETTSQPQPFKLRKPFQNSQAAATVDTTNQAPTFSHESVKEEAVAVKENHDGKPIGSAVESELSKPTPEPQPFKLRKAFQDSQTTASRDTTNQTRKFSNESVKEEAVVVKENHYSKPIIAAIETEISQPTPEPQPFRLRNGLRHSQTTAVANRIEAKLIASAESGKKELVADDGPVAGKQAGTAIDSNNSVPSHASQTIKLRKTFETHQTPAETNQIDRQLQSPRNVNEETIAADHHVHRTASDSVVRSPDPVSAEPSRSIKLRKTFHETPIVMAATEKQTAENAADTSINDVAIASDEKSDKAIDEAVGELAEHTPQTPPNSIKLRTAFRESQSKLSFDATHKAEQNSSNDSSLVSSQAQTTDDDNRTTVRSEPMPAAPLEPFKLRKKIVPSVSNTTSNTPSRPPRMDKSENNVAAVAASDDRSAAKELPPVERITKSSESHGPVPIKLRATFRDPQLTKIVVDSGNENSSTVSPSKNVVVVNHEVPMDSATGPAEAASKAKSEVTGTVKLRPAFRNSNINSPNAALKEPVPNQPSTVETSTSKFDSTNQEVRRESTNEPSSSKSAKRSITAGSTSADTTSVASAAAVPKSPHPELRASAWDNAIAPTTDSQPSKLKLRPDPTKPVPVPTKESEQQQTQQSPAGEQASTASSQSEQTPSVTHDSSSIDSALLGAADFKNSTQSRQKRPYAPEDDQAASTRAILRSGPVQGLAQLTGVPKSTASAMLGAFGLSLVIAGLWLIRTTMRIRQA